MKHLLLFLFIFGLTHCAIGQNRLADNKTIKKTFSETEIQDLQLIFNFFNESICLNLEPLALTSCYKDFFKKMENWEQTGNFELNISFNKQLKMYSQISESTFQEIWTFGKSIYRESPQDTFRTVSINLNGKYLIFLKKTGRKDEVINQYYESIFAAGDLTPSLITGLLVNHRYYNIEDIRIKLIVAIHYLTLNDQFNRNEKIN